MNLGTRLRGRTRNRWQYEVREEWKKLLRTARGMEEAPENGKESSHSAHANEYATDNTF